VDEIEEIKSIEIGTVN